jgi:hypothetical protein
MATASGREEPGLLAAAVFALMVAFGWSWSILIGLGAAISLLAAHTPKRG